MYSGKTLVEEASLSADGLEWVFGLAGSLPPTHEYGNGNLNNTRQLVSSVGASGGAVMGLSQDTVWASN